MIIINQPFVCALFFCPVLTHLPYDIVVTVHVWHKLSISGTSKFQLLKWSSRFSMWVPYTWQKWWIDGRTDVPGEDSLHLMGGQICLCCFLTCLYINYFHCWDYCTKHVANNAPLKIYTCWKTFFSFQISAENDCPDEVTYNIYMRYTGLWKKIPVIKVAHMILLSLFRPFTRQRGWSIPRTKRFDALPPTYLNCYRASVWLCSCCRIRSDSQTTDNWIDEDGLCSN